jgi:hypothetical protein
MSKIRLDFITNSSSTCFTIINKTNQDKTLVDFVLENEYLLDDFLREYNWYQDDDRFTNEQMIADAADRDETFPANTKVDRAYGDEDCDVLGHVYDYILRDGGQSESFEWKYKKSWR